MVDVSFSTSASDSLDGFDVDIVGDGFAKLIIFIMANFGPLGDDTFMQNYFFTPYRNS